MDVHVIWMLSWLIFFQLETQPGSSFAPKHHRSTQRCTSQFLPLSLFTPSPKPNLCLFHWLFLHRSQCMSLALSLVISFHAHCKCFCLTDSEKSKLRTKKGWVQRMHLVCLHHCMLEPRLDASSCEQLVRTYLLYSSYIEQQLRQK